METKSPLSDYSNGDLGLRLDTSDDIETEKPVHIPILLHFSQFISLITSLDLIEHGDKEK